MILDTSGLLAFFNRREPTHPAVVAAIEAANDELVVSPFVLAELDYLVATRVGVDAEMTMLEELSGGAWDLAHLDAADLARAASIIDRYTDKNLGLADASLVLLADRYRTRTILTLDQRHFTVLRPLRGGRFRLLP